MFIAFELTKCNPLDYRAQVYGLYLKLKTKQTKIFLKVIHHRKQNRYCHLSIIVFTNNFQLIK